MTKKKILTIIFAAIACGLLVWLVIIIGKDFSAWRTKHYARQSPAVKVALPSGEVLTAYSTRIPTATVSSPSREKIKIILKGTVKREADYTKNSTSIIESETGKKFILLNAPYVNTLTFNAMGKVVKLEGSVIQRTSFKDYPGIWIYDILEIEK